MASYREHFNTVGEEGLRNARGELGYLSLASHILKAIAPPQGARVLDLGCGDGRVVAALHQLRPDLECVGVDFAEKLIAQAQAEQSGKPGLTFHVRDLARDEVALGAFDCIYSFSVMQYLQPAQYAALNTRLLPALRPGGRVFHLSIPDVSKRVLLFMDDYLNQPSRSWAAATFTLCKVILVDVKRRLIGDRRYGDSVFHDAVELAALSAPRFQAEIIRPGDSWYRFDLRLTPTDPGNG